MTDTSQTLESQHQTVTALEQQLMQMRETLKLVNNEKDEASRQYQNYVRQLDAQQTKLLNEVYIYVFSHWSVRKNRLQNCMLNNCSLKMVIG